MPASSKTLIELETRFWQSMVDQDTEVALQLLNEPALMVSAHGAMKFDHAGYRKMAEQGTMVLCDMARPQQEIETDLHECRSFSLSIRRATTSGIAAASTLAKARRR